MNPVEPPSVSHPLTRALDDLGDRITETAGLPVWSLDEASTKATLARLVRLEAQLASVRLVVLAHAEQVACASATGASSTANWHAHAHQITRPDAHRQTRLALGLGKPTHACVRGALAAGLVHEDQARVVVAAVDALPDDLGPDLVAEAEAWLVEQAAGFDAAKLKILGDRLLEVVAPQQADAYEAAKLEAEEKRAAERTRLTLTGDGEGSVYVRGRIPVLFGDMLKKILLAYAAPQHQAAADDRSETRPEPAERKPSPQRMGEAFCELIESLTDRDAPATGGTGATVVITMDLETLLGGDGAAHLDTGTPLSPGLARRLACQAGLIPAVLGTGSVPLDLGRRTRFHTRAQRIAIALRDGGCTADGCDWPPGMCHVHHDPPWRSGGVTDLAHARMLCPFHHARAHDTTYDMHRLDDGKVSFHRRT